MSLFAPNSNVRCKWNTPLIMFPHLFNSIIKLVKAKLVASTTVFPFFGRVFQDFSSCPALLTILEDTGKLVAESEYELFGNWLISKSHICHVVFTRFDSYYKIQQWSWWFISAFPPLTLISSAGSVFLLLLFKIWANGLFLFCVKALALVDHCTCEKWIVRKVSRPASEMRHLHYTLYMLQEDLKKLNPWGRWHLIAALQTNKHTYILPLYKHIISFSCNLRLRKSKCLLISGCRLA